MKMLYEYKGTFEIIKDQIDLSSVKYRMFKKHDGGNIVIHVTNMATSFDEMKLQIIVNDVNWNNNINMYTIRFYNLIMPLITDMTLRNQYETLKELVRIEYHNCAIMNSENFVSGQMLKKQITDVESSPISFHNCVFTGNR